MWIQLTEKTSINGTPRRPEYRIDYPKTAAVELIAQGRAVAVDGPHEGRHGPGYPTGEVPPETSDPQKDDAVKVEESEEKTPIDVEDFSEIDGVGPATIEDIEDYLEENGLETVEDLLETDLTDLPGIGSATEDELEELLKGK